jgi:hypothetical protein
MRRRDFIMTTTGAAIAATLPLPALDSAGRMLQVFRRLRASREGLLPDIALDRMTRTIADLRSAGIEIAPTQLDREWRPPVGLNYAYRCNWHVAALAGPLGRRKLRCLICESEDLRPEAWMTHPFLLRGEYFRVR